MENSQARIVNLTYKWTPSTESIESETDVLKAERTADEFAAKFLRLSMKIIDAKHDLAELERESDSMHYLFCAARAKQLELKNAHSTTETTVVG